MSVSTDGYVKQWNMKKGLFANDVMVLKRIQNPALANETGQHLRH